MVIIYVIVGVKFDADVQHEAGIWTSPDGITWTRRIPNWTQAFTEEAEPQLWDITYADNRFVAIGQFWLYDPPDYDCPIPVVISYDGINWRGYIVEMGLYDDGWDCFGAFPAITYGNNLLIAVHDDKASISLDGINWTTRSNTGVVYSAPVVAAGNNRLVSLEVRVKYLFPGMD